MPGDSAQQRSGPTTIVERRERWRAERLLAAIVDSTDDAVYSKDLDGTILSWNAAAERIFGYTAEQAVGQPVDIIIPDERRDEAAEILAQIASGECVDRRRTVRITRGGKRIHVSLAVSPLRNPDGTVIGALAIGRDITDEVDLIRAVNEEARRFRTVLENTSLLVCIADLQGGIVHCNQALADLAGLTPDGMVGRSWNDVFVTFPEEQRFRQLCRQELVLPFHHGTIRSGDDDLSIAWTNVPLNDDQGHLSMVASLGDNITAHRAIDRELTRIREERRGLMAAILAAESAERARIAEALHDDTIQVMTAALMAIDRVSAVPSSQLAEARAAMSLAIERARQLMFELHPALLDQQGLACAIDGLCQRTAIGAGFDVAVEVTARRFPSPVEALVYRTVREAMINAARHSHARHVLVKITDRDDHIDGYISDDGVGFDPEAVNAREGAEMHLGLAALAERLRLANGTSKVVSRPGHGTVITFSLPAA